MNTKQSVVVFCGAGIGNKPIYHDSAFNLGEYLALNGIHVIYGGAKVGLMGALADGVLNANGKITGVIPHFLKNKEIAHSGLTDLIIVDSMHERKLRMYELGNAIIALPGGWGTMDELFEILTWGQLGLHAKPVCILNINGYYNTLLAQFKTMIQEGFLKQQMLDNLIITDKIENTLNLMSL